MQRFIIPSASEGRDTTTFLSTHRGTRHMQVVNRMAASSSTNVPTGIPSNQSLKFDGTGSYYALNPFPYAPPLATRQDLRGGSGVGPYADRQPHIRHR